MKKLTILLLSALLLASCVQEVPADVSVSLAESSTTSVVSSEEFSSESSEETSAESSQDTSSEEEDTTEWPHHRNPYEDNETPVTIAEDFPDFWNGELETFEGTQEEDEYFLVVKTEADRVYVATPYENQAYIVLVGDFAAQCGVGDYILVSLGDYLYHGAFFYCPNAEIQGVETDMDKIYQPIAVPLKPVIYLYPEQETQVDVRLDYDGTFTSTYPAYKDGEGWENLTVLPDGTIYGADGKEYYCLFWEGAGQTQYDFASGFCVRGEDTEAFLETALREIGLTAREANEFIIFWLPHMQNNAYNVISFQTDAYTDSAVLTVTPEPDSVLRVFMAYYASDVPVEIEPQTFDGFERNGFTVVEWGGSDVTS